jgi:hypothetical protein
MLNLSFIGIHQMEMLRISLAICACLKQKRRLDRLEQVGSAKRMKDSLEQDNLEQDM